MNKRELDEEISRRNPTLREIMLPIILMLIEKDIITAKELFEMLDSNRG